MDMNPIQARMLMIRQLQNNMLAYLYSAQEKSEVKQLCKIAIENQLLLKCDTASFTFNGRMHGSIDSAVPTNKINKELHPSLLKQVSDILSKHTFDATAIKTHISHMFSTVLMKAKHVNDLKRLLPNAFLTQIRAVDPDIFNTGDPLSDQEIASIQKHSAKSIAYINELCLTRLLLTK